MRKKLLVFTEMSFRGSGYYYLMAPILEQLSLEYDIKVIGNSYEKSEHNYGFSIVSANNLQEGLAIANIIINAWKPDVFICGFDIPLQIAVYNNIKQFGLKYIAITPLENPPLTPSWAAELMQMDFVFFISELGKQAALKAGLTKVEHLSVSTNLLVFTPADDDEKSRIRQTLGIADEFVVITVADNQERKNIWAEFEILSKLKQAGKRIKFLLVTRENSAVGYKLRDFAVEYGINKETIIIERGVPIDQLRNLYVASDLYLTTSKAEGLGIPILEAMACGLPVVGTDTGAITELLSNGKGVLVRPAYTFRDVWGNSLRAMIDVDDAYEKILNLMGNPIDTKPALDYVRSLTEVNSAAQVKTVIEEMTHG